MFVYFERQSGDGERGWIPVDVMPGVESVELIKVGHSFFWFMVFENGTFTKLLAKEYRLKKIAGYEQTSFVFE